MGNPEGPLSCEDGVHWKEGPLRAWPELTPAKSKLVGLGSRTQSRKLSQREKKKLHLISN